MMYQELLESMLNAARILKKSSLAVNEKELAHSYEFVFSSFFQSKLIKRARRRTFAEAGRMERGVGPKINTTTTPLQKG